MELRFLPSLSYRLLHLQESNSAINFYTRNLRDNLGLDNPSDLKENNSMPYYAYESLLKDDCLATVAITHLFFSTETPSLVCCKEHLHFRNEYTCVRLCFVGQCLPETVLLPANQRRSQSAQNLQIERTDFYSYLLLEIADLDLPDFFPLK